MRNLTPQIDLAASSSELVVDTSSGPDRPDPPGRTEVDCYQLPATGIRLQRGSYRVELFHDITDIDLIDALYLMMHEAFEPIDELTAMRHCYDRDEWEGYMRDPRIGKLVLFCEDEPIGILTAVYRLELATWLSPQFLRRCFPGRRIFYQNDTIISPAAQRSGHAGLLLEVAMTIAREDDAIATFSVSDYNISWGFLDFVQAEATKWCDGVVGEIDAHRYFAFDAAAADRAEQAWYPEHAPYLPGVSTTNEQGST